MGTPAYMYDPQGNVRQVAPEDIPQARASGGIAAVQMYDPQGNQRWVRENDVLEGLQNGGRLVNQDHWYSPLTQTLSDAVEGAKVKSMRTAVDASNLLEKLPVVGSSIRRYEETNPDEIAFRQRAAAPLDTTAKKVGGGLWDAAEFMAMFEAGKAGGGAALDALKPSQYITKVMPHLKDLEAYQRVQQLVESEPTLAKLLPSAAGMAATGGAQTLLHGGTAGQAGKAATEQGLLGIILPPVLGKFGDYTKSVLGKASDLLGDARFSGEAADAGVTPPEEIPAKPEAPQFTPTPRPAPPQPPTPPEPVGPVPRKPAPIEPTPTPEPPEAPTPLAKPGPVEPTPPPQPPEPAAMQGPERAPIEQRVADLERTFAQRAAQGGNAVVAQQLESLNNIIMDPQFKRFKLADKAEVFRMRNELAGHLSSGTAPESAADALSQVSDFGDAAKLLRAAPDAAHARLNALTGGEYETITNELEKLAGKNDRASVVRRAELNNNLQSLIDRPGAQGTTSPELRALHGTMRMNADLLDSIDEAFNNSFKGAGGTGDFDYAALQKNWRNAVNTHGVDAMKGVLGEDHYNAINDVINEIAGEPEADKLARAAVEQRDAEMMAEFKQKVAEAKTLDGARQAAVNAQHAAEQGQLTEMHQQELKAHAQQVADAQSLDEARQKAQDAEYTKALAEHDQARLDRARKVAENRAQYNAMKRRHAQEIESIKGVDTARRQQMIAEHRRQLTDWKNEADRITKANKIAQDAADAAEQARVQGKKADFSTLVKGFLGYEAYSHLVPAALKPLVFKGAAAAWAGKKILSSPLTARLAASAIHGAANPKVIGPAIAAIQMSQQRPPQRPAAPRRDQYMVESNPAGLVERGNLPIWNRPTIKNDDGSHSSELSFSREENGKEVLVPSIVGGRFMTPDGKMPPMGHEEKQPDGKMKYIPTPQEQAMYDRAWEHYKKTGQHLGKFNNADNADAYANKLHSR